MLCYLNVDSELQSGERNQEHDKLCALKCIRLASVALIECKVLNVTGNLFHSSEIHSSIIS